MRRARPRPFSSSRTDRTPGRCAANSAATPGVVSVDALSAMVIRKAYGNVRARCSCSRSTHGWRSFSSL
ncbi:hypothetical protein SGLAM104S_06813 [Streptomyces glaucescens]